jgi:hypothetical protein
VKLGDTFVWCPTGRIDHLWILMSAPAANGGDCVVINLTESSHGAHSYTLKPGQHRYIYKDSDVNFGDAFKTPVDEIPLDRTLWWPRRRNEGGKCQK